MKKARPTPHESRGFTLIEVMIAVAIVGILAAIAVPSYARYVEKTRRTDATIFLTEAAGEQFRFHSENNRYAPDFAALAYPARTIVTPEGFYRVAVRSADAFAFELVATPVADAAQANDADCASIVLDSAGVKTPADCW